MTTEIFEKVRTRRAQISFEVKLNNTKLFTKIAKWEEKEQQRITNYASNVEIVIAEIMEKIMKTSLYLRVQITNGERIDPDYRKVLGKIYLPARWYTMLDNIGQAHDYNRNIKFSAVYDIPAEDLLSAEELLGYSEILAYLKPEGYTCVKGIPLHEDGSLEFMTKIALANGQALDTIRGMDVHNPVYGFFANVFENDLLDVTYREVELMFRYEYSSADVYGMQFTDYYRSVSSNDKTKTVPTDGGTDNI